MTSLESLNNLLNKMKPILRAAGVLDHQLDIVPKEYKTKTLAVAFDWLHDIYLSHDYARVIKIWTSVAPDVWVKYRLYGIENLTEQRLLLAASSGLIKLWKNKRPRLFINRQTEICESCEEKATFTYKNDYKQCGSCGKINEQDSDI